MAIEKFFTPRFMKAVNENSEAGYRSIMAEPCPGVFTFEIFQPHFCELLLSEVSALKVTYVCFFFFFFKLHRCPYLGFCFFQ